MHFGDVLRQGGVHRGRAGLAQPAALPDLQQIRPRTTLRLLPQRLLLLPQHLLAVQQPDIGQTGKVRISAIVDAQISLIVDAVSA